MKEINEKILDKIKKLKAKADSCEEIGSQAEAEAFAAAVNNLLTKHNLTMSEVNWAKRKDEDPISRVWVDFKTYGIPVKRQRREWSEKLAAIVARAHFCKILIRPGSNEICLVGHKTDREVAEYLYVTLYHLAEKMADQAYAVYWRECAHAGDVTQCRGFRASWLAGFIRGLDARFQRERTIVNDTYNSTALVRIDQSLTQVERWMKDNLRSKMANGLNQFRYHSEGIKRGHQAANEVSLRANALRTNPSREQRRVS